MPSVATTLSDWGDGFAMVSCCRSMLVVVVADNRAIPTYVDPRGEFFAGAPEPISSIPVNLKTIRLKISAELLVEPQG